MGRGGAANNAGAGAGLRRHDFDTAVRALLGPQLGLALTASGQLTAAFRGRPAGTTFVVLTAETAMDRDLARDALGARVGTADLEWEHGWIGRRDARNQRVTDLHVFPADRRSASA